MKTNPNAMKTVKSNTVFTNVAETSDGGFFWEGLEKEMTNDVKVESWLGDRDWKKESGKPAAHPNSRSGCYLVQTRFLTGCHHIAGVQFSVQCLNCDLVQ